jgi:hypothetical protein
MQVVEFCSMRNVLRFTIWAHRSAESIFGPSSSPVNRNGEILSFDNEDRAHEECAVLNARLGSSTVRYTVESEPKVLAVGGDHGN